MLNELIEKVIVDSLYETSHLLLKEYHSNDRVVDVESSHDLKLELDRKSEKIIIDRIQSSFPGHAVLSEEKGLISGRDYLWMIDPVDGTVNYYYGLPWFCISIACYRLNHSDLLQSADQITDINLLTPAGGGIYSPVEKKIYLTTQNNSFTLNGESITPRLLKDLSQVLFSLNIGSTEPVINRMTSIIKQIAPVVKKIRVLGSAALDIVSVSSGELGVCYYYGLKLWDLAAGVMMVRNSGGKVILNQLDTGNYEALCYRSELETDLKKLFHWLF